LPIELIIVVAILIDLIIGDPRFLPHPVVMMGRGIKWLERAIRSFSEKPSYLRVMGFLLTAVIVIASYRVTDFLITWSSSIHPYFSLGLTIFLISTTIATKGLADAGREVYQFLSKKDLQGARAAVAMIVGRDTEKLGEQEISRATVETVAENTVDAIIAPLFFALLGGAPLAMAYRAINTCDSMVGYKNERYQDLGYASAKLDDFANWIPARLTMVLIAFSALLSKKHGWSSLKIAWRDARKHPSPNSGFPEAAVAGALGIQLGGTNVYGGKPSHRAYLGDNLRPIVAEDIPKTIHLMYLTVILFAGIILIVHSFSIAEQLKSFF
jgi:adenosylcobinamide-phosphate synthase